MSEQDDKFQEEWNRAINNPDNMIVSDSLMSRLGSTDLEEVEKTDSFLQCTIMNDEGTIITGRTASFFQNENESSVSFEVTHTTANKMLMFGKLASVIFSQASSEDEVVWGVLDGERVSKKTEFFAQNDALITIVITAKKSAELVNSYTAIMEDSKS